MVLYQNIGVLYVCIYTRGMWDAFVIPWPFGPAAKLPNPILLSNPIAKFQGYLEDDRNIPYSII